MKKSISRVLSLLLALSLCAGLLALPAGAAEADASEAGVTLSLEYEGMTFTVTAAGKIAVGEELTLTGSNMPEDYGNWSFNIYAEKDNAKRYNMYVDGALAGFKTFEDCAAIIASDVYQQTAFRGPNESFTFTLAIPEEYQDWDLYVRLSLPGQVFQNIPFRLDAGSGEPQPEPEPASFPDVAEDSWYYTYVQTIAAAGWMNGNADGTFQPAGSLSVAQVLVIAARIHASSFEKEIAPVEGGTWYTQYVDYCVENGIIAQDAFSAEDMNRPATRFEVVEILDKAPQPLRFVESREVEDGYIPDLSEADEHGETVYKWYRAGVIDGDSGTHKFNGGSTITRAEASVMLCRIMVLVPRITA